MTFEFSIRAGASLLVGVALLIAACSRPGSTTGSSALKPIDQAALQTMVDRTAKELLIPGAVVLLRTPQGEFTVTYGTTLLGAVSPPRADTKVCPPAEVLAIAFKPPPYFPPGTDFHYSNANYALLGLIAEKIEGKPLASCFQDRLFGPLGLKETVLPAITSNTLPDPYSHGYLYGGCSFSKLVGKPYPPDLQAAARAGTLKPDDCTGQNPSYASAAGGVISTANDLATWIQALVGGRVLNADYQRQWLDSVQLEDPSKPDGLQYGYGITQLRWGANTVYFHGVRVARFHSLMGDDPARKMKLLGWANLNVSPDGKGTAQCLLFEMLDP